VVISINRISKRLHNAYITRPTNAEVFLKLTQEKFAFSQSWLWSHKTFTLSKIETFFSCCCYSLLAVVIKLGVSWSIWSFMFGKKHFLFEHYV